MALVLSGDGKIGTRVKPNGINLTDSSGAIMDTDVHFEYMHGASYLSNAWTTNGSGGSSYTQFKGTNTTGKLQYRDPSTNAIVGVKYWDPSHQINTNYNPGNYFNYMIGGFTAPVTGYYLISMGCMSASNSGSYLGVTCCINGINTTIMQRWEYEASSSEFGMDAAIVQKVNKYDTVHWQWYNSYLSPTGWRCGITLLGEA